MSYENIPEELKNKEIFCLWKYQKKDGEKPTKPPYSAKTGQKVNLHNQKLLATFDETISKLDGFDGIGIKLVDDLLGIDLDNCITDGLIDARAKEIIKHFSNAYIEYSPSANGFHILMKYKGFYDKKNYYIKHDGIEVYSALSTTRYLTITGNVYQKGSLAYEDIGLKWLLETHMKKDKAEGSELPLSSEVSYLSDESVMEKATNAVNGEKFKKLWTGDISDYTSHSEADAALSSILAFYCGGNRNQMDRLFRNSALYRPKWDEYRGTDTYGDITIKNAISKSKAFYTPVQKLSAYDDFDDKKEKLRELNPADTSKYPWTDIGSAKLFADFCKDILRFVPERKQWFFYEDGIWQSDVGSLKAMKFCMELADLLHMFLLDLKDEHKREGFKKFTKQWQRHSYRVNLLKDAQVYQPISASDFDKDPYIFNCQNCTLDIRTRTIREHSPNDKLTKISKVKYDPFARSDRWTGFIHEIMSGDKEKAKFLQKIFGYGLTGDTRHECMTILYGASTRNGKGTLCESILKVLGSYGCTARPETISMKLNTNSSQSTEDIARLAGVRFVNISEPGKGLVLNVAQVKSMTGNDTINARFLHENSFDFKPQFKIFINTNYLPAVNDMTIFTLGRVIIIPFERHFDEFEQDKGLKHEFAKAEVQSAILNWLLEGHELLKKEGLKLPPSVVNATKQYQHDSNKLVLFMEDCMEAGDFEERTSEVYYRYKSWCNENGYYPESMKNFKQSLETVATVKRKRPKAGGEKTTVVIGYRFLSDFLE